LSRRSRTSSHTAHAGGSSKSALEQRNAHPIDLVLGDSVMAGPLDALAPARTIRSRGHAPRVSLP
jgi:hypothetical protein